MGRPAKPKQNPIHAAVSTWLDSLPPGLLDIPADAHDANEAKQRLLALASKRWVVYEPMVLLPSGSFASESWVALLDAVTALQKDFLWTAILQQLSPAFPKPPLTHLAINEPIPLHLSLPRDEETQRSSGQEYVPLATEQRDEEENILRSPISLRPLYGDFGPLLPSDVTPTAADFDRALWVSTTQNGLRQVWSPRYTMFSRGNVKEKARVLGFPLPAEVTRPSSKRGTGTRLEPTCTPTSTPPTTATAAASTTSSTPAPEYNTWAVDLYAGIGYFVFSYAARGLRVLCWELNAWSAEGLRRGALANGFSVRVVYPRRSTASPPSPTPSPTSAPSSSSPSGPGPSPGPGDVTPTPPNKHPNLDRNPNPINIDNNPNPNPADLSPADIATDADTDADADADANANAEALTRAIASRAQIILLVQDNRLAAAQIRRHWQQHPSTAGRVVHVNCGFLPTSAPVWRDAWEILGVTISNSNFNSSSSGGRCGGGDGEGEEQREGDGEEEAGGGVGDGDEVDGEDRDAEGWLHLHENVAEKDIEARKGEVQALFDGWSGARDGDGDGRDRRGRQRRRTAEVRHVEKVKTYAPGVWHCVFDVCCYSSRAIAE